LQREHLNSFSLLLQTTQITCAPVSTPCPSGVCVRLTIGPDMSRSLHFAVLPIDDGIFTREKSPTHARASPARPQLPATGSAPLGLAPFRSRSSYVVTSSATANGTGIYDTCVRKHACVCTRLLSFAPSRHHAYAR